MNSKMYLLDFRAQRSKVTVSGKKTYTDWNCRWGGGGRTTTRAIILLSNLNLKDKYVQLGTNQFVLVAWTSKHPSGSSSPLCSTLDLNFTWYSEISATQSDLKRCQVLHSGQFKAASCSWSLTIESVLVSAGTEEQWPFVGFLHLSFRRKWHLAGINLLHERTINDSVEKCFLYVFSNRKLEKILSSESQSEGKMKYFTGEWFYEAKSRRHMDKIHGSEIILASMKPRRGVFIIHSSVCDLTARGSVTHVVFYLFSCCT